MTDTDFKEIANAQYEANYLTLFHKKNNIPLSKNTEEKVKESYKKMIQDKQTLSKITKKGKEYETIYHIFRDSDLGKRTVVGEIFKAPKWSLKETKKFVSEIYTFDKRIKSHYAMVKYNSSQHKHLMKLGAKNDGIFLAALVSDSYQYLKEWDFPSEWKVMDMKKIDIEECIDLELLAHGSDKSSRSHTLNRKKIQTLYNFCLKRKITVRLIKEDGVIIGLIVPWANPLGMGSVMSVAVNPDHQGRGLSKLLYLEAVKYWKKNKVKVYAGVSSTNAVLGFAKKLKRKPVAIYLKLKKK